ncbi:MAG: M14 family metallocarboxypeptidase [Burkholderiaceae bacterium]
MKLSRWPLALVLATLLGCASTPLPPWPAPTASAAPTLPASAPAAAPASAPTEAAVATPVPDTAVPALTPVAPAPAASAAVAAESAGVAARFPDPPVSYSTPAFESGRTSFTSNAELHAFVRGLLNEGAGRAGAPRVRLLALGSSQKGVTIEALQFTRADRAAARSTVLLIGQQHGDEPAGAEALLVVAQELAQGRLPGVLDRVDVVILPRANPDGAALEQRLSASGIDINRDHLLLRTPEAQAQANLARQFDPAVVVDAHEYTALGRWAAKFDAVPAADALLQYATVANLPPFVTKAAEEWFRAPLVQRLKSEGLSTDWYHTTSADLNDRQVSMGGVQPDTGRNVGGLRNAVSLLIETRGIGIGRAHFKRRVFTQVTAIESVLASAALRADDLAKLRQYVAQEVSAQACRGDVVVEAVATPSEYSLHMLDPASGADKTVAVAWNSALKLDPLRLRARACGYWLRPDQIDTVMRLRALGVQVSRFEESGGLRGEIYRETARDVGVRSDVRGSVADAGGVLHLKVDLVPALVDVRAGSYYVGLDQPLANLVVAALEPDTQNSYVAHGILGSVEGEARVLQRPELRMSPMP